MLSWINIIFLKDKVELHHDYFRSSSITVRLLRKNSVNWNSPSKKERLYYSLVLNTRISFAGIRRSQRKVESKQRTQFPGRFLFRAFVSIWTFRDGLNERWGYWGTTDRPGRAVIKTAKLGKKRSRWIAVKDIGKRRAVGGVGHLQTSLLNCIPAEIDRSGRGRGRVGKSGTPSRAWAREEPHTKLHNSSAARLGPVICEGNFERSGTSGNFSA